MQTIVAKITVPDTKAADARETLEKDLHILTQTLRFRGADRGRKLYTVGGWPAMQRYLIETFGDGPDFQLGVHGPYKSEKERKAAADQIKRETDGDSQTYRLNIRANGRADFPVG